MDISFVSNNHQEIKLDLEYYLLECVFYVMYVTSYNTDNAVSIPNADQ